MMYVANVHEIFHNVKSYRFKRLLNYLKQGKTLDVVRSGRFVCLCDTVCKQYNSEVES